MVNQAKHENNLMIGGTHMDHKRVSTAGAADQGHHSMIVGNPQI